MLAKSLLWAGLILGVAWAFPNGGPIDACVKAKPNQPNHGQTASQPLNTLPFLVEASSEFYRPNDIITLTIRATQQNTPFKGFFFQARDEQSNEWIGVFEESQRSKSYGECSAVTHTDNKHKDAITLVWHAPPDRSGRVFFVGSVVESYSKFWSDIVAHARQ